MFEKLEMPNSTIFVIFGATGDLTHRKLLPALYRLYTKNHLPKCFAVVAVARRDKTSEEYREEALGSIKTFEKNMDEKKAKSLLKNLHYFRTDFDMGGSYGELKLFLDKLDADGCTDGNRIFYLATLPKHFRPITLNLKKHGFLDRERGIKYRLIIEKPFGTDLKSAIELNKAISTVFKEEEIFRIDHYLGKESVQNLFALRFANSIFEPVWNHENIENIQITATEGIGVGTRGGYYDKSGALRDMVQNHLLQVLSLVAMEQPKDFTTTNIKDEKVKVLRSIKPLTTKEIDERVVFGQYIKGKTGIDYTAEPGVAKDSRTETYAAMTLYVDNQRWKGVPFYLKTGKNLKRKATEVVIYFKHKVPFSNFPDFQQNVMVIRLQPEEGIYMRFNIKEPGNEFRIQRVSMDFCHECLFGINTPEAYEKLLYNAFTDDSTLFTRWDEVREAWKLIDPIESHWRSSKKRPYPYRSGTWGPDEADKLVDINGHHWRLNVH